MGEFCEFDIDFNQFDDLRAVVVHDECGAHEDVWFYRLDGLKAENAQLRELVKDMWFADYAGHFSTLPEHQDHQAAVWKRMRELGIEVDG